MGSKPQVRGAQAGHRARGWGRVRTRREPGWAQGHGLRRWKRGLLIAPACSRALSWRCVGGRGGGYGNTGYAWECPECAVRCLDRIDYKEGLLTWVASDILGSCVKA